MNCEHDWATKESAGIMFRFCPKCERLERVLWHYPSWGHYPSLRRNPYTGEILPSYGYHDIVKNVFDETHELPSKERFQTSPRPCWMCGKQVSYIDLAIKQSDWPEVYIDLCSDCYIGKNEAWKKHRWLCFFGLHKWHPILGNPKKCYRCGFEYDDYALGHKGASKFAHKPKL